MLMDEKTIYALGFFDVVHLGHQALLTACRALAEQTGCKAGVLTFDLHPQALVAGQPPLLINTLEDRHRLLRQYGMQNICTLPFDEGLRTMPWKDFFELLVTRYNAGGLVCGDDFRFGYRGEGTADLLRQACESAGLPCTIVPAQLLDGVRISSTHIRKLLADGNMEDVAQFLGHPHILTDRVAHGKKIGSSTLGFPTVNLHIPTGEVVPGRGLGHTMGTPTANLQIPEGVLLPGQGVYACKATLEQGQTCLAVTNIGSRPTVDGHHITVEPWLLDFTGDLYRHRLTLSFHAFLRREEKFPSLADLKAQIWEDARKTRKIFENQ